MATIEEARKRAIAANTEAWRLLDKPSRTTPEDHAMIEAAHESDRWWRMAGTGANLQRGAWLIARAYIAAGLAEPALHFAAETEALTVKHRAVLSDFDLAFCEESLARAAALAGRRDRATQHHARAAALGAAIADPEDRAEFFRQFEAGPWFGLTAG